MTEIPEHLLARSRSRRFGLGRSNTDQSDRREKTIVLPPNSVFPWNDMIDMANGDNRGIGICLSSIHDQLCVIADLLRIQIEQKL
jgi:hypothetical protein